MSDIKNKLDFLVTSHKKLTGSALTYEIANIQRMLLFLVLMTFIYLLIKENYWQKNIKQIYLKLEVFLVPTI